MKEDPIAAANAVRDGARRGPGRRSAEESRLTRERLLLEAERHFARSGYAGTTVRELGAALGIAGSSVLHHVGSKRKLYAAVLERISASATAVLEGIERGDPARAMHQFTERFLAWSEAHPHYVEILLREMMENPARIGEVHRWLLADFVRQAVALAAEAVGERRAKQIDPDLLPGRAQDLRGDPRRRGPGAAAPLHRNARGDAAGFAAAGGEAIASGDSRRAAPSLRHSTPIDASLQGVRRFATGWPTAGSPVPGACPA